MNKQELRSRFKDAPWFPKGESNVVVGGAGGIGSWLTFLLARAGFSPIVYDFDTIEAHNLGGQLFGIEHINMHKTEAIKEIVSKFCNTDIMIFSEKFDTESMSAEHMFSAFDNMQARKDMFEIWWRDNSQNPNAVFIDGRLLMEQLQVFCVTPATAKEYHTDHLFDDSEVAAENCTMKQTSHSASMIASLMVGFYTNHVTNIVQGSVVRQVPFIHEYFIPINLTY
jgi:molybdopterin/thiamine biosynthesis adenylyltransferase